jgi:F0F1-type ATP synthase membrane subunit b/b'
MEKIVSLIKNICKFILVVTILLVILSIIYLGIDIAFKNVLSALSRAVLSNFIVFAGVIVFVSKKNVHPVKLLEDAQVAVKESIMESESTKVRSEERLRTIEDSITNIEQEINAIIDKSVENADLVGKKILQDGEKTALVIQENTTKAIENSRMILKNELLKKASLASVEVAKSHIIQELSRNQELHDKLIDESIEAIEGAGL